MRNIFNKFFFAALLVFSAFSCTEDNILNLQPINNISVDQSFSSPSLIESSINGMYNAAAIGQFNSTSPNGGRGYVWGAAFVQQGDNRGEDVVNQATFYQLTYTATYDPTTANNVYYWVDGYRLINRCNLVIEGVTKAVADGIISADTGNDYIGQAKFLRAITHFELCNFFARPYHINANAIGIPYREAGVDTQAEIDAGLAQGRGTVGEVYSKVLADLNDAENLISNTSLTKASKNAAIAFKTRVYLHMRDWPNVIKEGLKLEGKYTLEAHPGTPFLNSYKNSESIFSIMHDATNNPGVNAGLASQYKRRELVCISPIIWTNPGWLADDIRRYENNSDPLAMVFTGTGGVKFTNKYKDDSGYTDAAPIIRYAEVILNMAEAYARSGNAGDGLSYLNKVRNRSLADAASQAYTGFGSDADLVKAILLERRIEFLMEGRRWQDIHRLQQDDIAPIDGIPAKVANGVPSAAAFDLSTPYAGPYGVANVPYADHRFVWPIPLIELDSNPNLGQNDGY
ncbi:MAG: RagB/SusD family nutrient uptake outer membrane protein [Chitinophagales bacterium]|nr:RagB/SusD family nutrient uptake outer membrane protein [Chitinophagales bacterium]